MEKVVCPEPVAGNPPATGADHCDLFERLCCAVAAQVTVLEMLRPESVGQRLEVRVQHWGRLCAGCVPGLVASWALERLHARSDCSVDFPVMRAGSALTGVDALPSAAGSLSG